MSKSPRLTRTDSGAYDWLIEDGKVQWAEDGTQAAQRAMQRFLIFKGEQSLDGKLTTKTELGTKHYEILLAMDVSRAEKELEIKSRYLGAPNVEKFLSFTWAQVGNSITVTGSLKTAWGAESVGEVVTPL